MSRYSQSRYVPGDNSSSSGPGGLLGRILAALAGIIVLAVSIFVGAIFIAGFIGLLLLGGVIFALRMWWLKRQMTQYETRHGDLDAEYRVVEEEIHAIRRDES